MAALPAPGMLAGVLSEIWQAAIPLAEKRRLSARVAVATVHGGGGGAVVPEPTVEPIPLVALALSAVGKIEGTKSMGMSEAKQALRARGVAGSALASRLGKLSKIRNGCAHPDVGLVDDILAL